MLSALRRCSAALLLLAGVLAAPPAWAAELLGRVVGLSDGDTLTLLTAERRQVRVRLGEIDTPESRQPYGTRAQQVLSGLVFGENVRVVVQDTDRYGRPVGRVYAGPLDVNAEMVRQGAAWVYRQYSRDASLLQLEAEAKTARRGLWALPEAERTPPWEWRAAQRNGGALPTTSAPAAPARSSPPTSSSFSCGAKQYCREMTSCAEARFYLQQCGLSRLDGDRDGVPCEALCR
ncbi:thermonuclease family protein [Roseomonas sp. SSH11]|uniref:Thermonuclease family protein n=1 Tax=Pararoseomonas baculiformis TaxID=2820812 RepID=A0ABS4AJX5_9PROT|nr:thermonuclease family protein [Pararoseomonas baculiformis]MBP0447337.1 thermonuclease family protein [Pararoseomonas baculiformis]